MSETTDEMFSRWHEDQARWERHMRRMRRISMAFLVPYALAGGVAVWTAVYVAMFLSARIGWTALASILFVIGAQWLQPYLTRRGDRKDSISQTTPEPTDNVEESATAAE